ncbi:MAG: TRM11 family SAM-dependent methyltransferase [Mangrovibacterium sp.]
MGDGNTSSPQFIKMHRYSYIYSFKYDTHNSELCQLESRQLFGKDETNKLLFSNVKVDPSISPFIKNRFEIRTSSAYYSQLLTQIEAEAIQLDAFKAEYLVLDGDTTSYPERLEKLRDIGDRISGNPDYKSPQLIYAICRYQNSWYFGVLTKHNTDWFKHRKKPCSFSSAINMDIAKTLVSIASQGNKSRRLLDACCGVGTVLLEACIVGIDIEGCDINWKACQAARKNLAHYKYTAKVYRSDIGELNSRYDSVIVDLPYNLYSFSNEAVTQNILVSTAKLASRIVIVSTSGIDDLLAQAGLMVTDCCIVGKKGKNFLRKVWICEKTG